MVNIDDDDRAFQVAIDNHSLQSVWIKEWAMMKFTFPDGYFIIKFWTFYSDGIDSVKKITFVLAESLENVLKSEDGKEDVHFTLKEFVMEMCDRFDHHEAQSFLQEIVRTS